MAPNTLKEASRETNTATSAVVEAAVVNENTPGLEAQFASHASELMERYVFSLPHMREFHAGTWTHASFYRRHMVEAVLRIRLNNEADSYCMYKISKRDPLLAQKLAHYLAEELGHEHMFAHDLKAMGLCQEEVDATEPFFATSLLMGFMRTGVDVDGPMATMIWNWFVEWYSVTYNKRITQKAKEAVGDKAVRGTTAHIGLDDSYGHVSLMFSNVAAVIARSGDEKRAKEYLRRFVRLVGMYFEELSEATLRDRPD